MIMEGIWKQDLGIMNPNPLKFDGSPMVLSDPKFLNAMDLNETFLGRSYMNHIPDQSLRRSSPSSSSNHVGELHEDFELSDVVFKYINQMLMEENVDDKSSMLHESAALQAAEKSFYDALMVSEPASCSSHPTVTLYDSDVTIREDCNSPLVPSVSINVDTESRSRFSYCSTSSNSCVVDCLADSPVSIQSESAIHFRKGIGESSSYPLRSSRTLDQLVTKSLVLGADKIQEESRGRKNLHHTNLDEDRRIFKQSAVYTDPTVRSKMFDDVLLCGGGKNLPQRNFVYNGVQHRRSTAKGRGKKGVKKDVVDLRTLLSLCAQAVAANDQRSAIDLLKQIREHASPTGDSMQRLAHYFSTGLEARMAGSGTAIYKALLSIPASGADVLKAYHLYLSCCPFMKISNFISNKTILHTAQNKKKLHIIDFGILYGFQWPCIIQRLSKRPGGPPELRITGIDSPCPGFRPSRRIEETGRRLANYAETFNVPFKFKAIAQKWETITIDDLELDSDETVVVNCAYRFRYLLDETVMADSPRNKVLNLIRKTKPDIFIQGVVNGAYNAPFFITRFREALFFYSSMFDMIEANAMHETAERLLIERYFWGREAMNAIACEGGERIERPETYKQWQVRNSRAGFRQLPLNQELLKLAKERVKSCYHRDFGIDEDGYWMLQGWKGRIICALSSWKPS